MPSAPNPHADNASGPLRVAIIGAGITGVNLALGLQARGVNYTIYERAPGFREIGAGIGFSPNAERAMGLLDPGVLAAFKTVANPNGEDYFQWVDGHGTDELMFRLHVGKDGFQGCRRSDVLEEWARLIPAKRVKFGRQIDGLGEGRDGVIIMKFADGSREEADVVVGCDGIRSRVRQLMLGEQHPAAHPHYTNRFCFRALVPMGQARAAIGEYKTSTRFMYNGPGAHAITYPVGGNSVLNVMAAITDPNPWSEKQHTASGSKSEALAAFGDWHPTVRAIIDLLPDTMDKWAIFDMAEHPADSYVKGAVCVAGDAAHAAGPHLGAGGGMGIEDALALSALLEAVDKVVEEGKKSRAEAIATALVTYNTIRYARTQWVVQATRAACDLFQWRNPEVGSNAAKFGEEITWRFHKIWDYDVRGMVDEGAALFAAKIGDGQKGVILDAKVLGVKLDNTQGE